ncbi:helix-turn-helix domain-containing protein [Winogradskyella sp.]|uniref:winged helix-turn-helix transcriptional regulator n=1 Tax=Winogradskyella sp. TaxID=1883156 RepID=UPI0025DEBA5C|nr:helix-turn-helix domain-containing protein [Winogradskyella sp.]MCT4629051.1 helix-turn-helix transcriptional regulator [Winogradskyella sp.]
MGRKLIENYNECPITHSMNIVGNKWTSIIVYTLADRKLRFGELAIRIDKISRKVLSNELKEMEQRGIINRESYAETPPRVEYSLTKKGEDLLPILNQLCAWSKGIDLDSDDQSNCSTS